MKRKIMFVMMGVLLAAGQAQAFSVGPGFFVLSNYELVKQADTIVLTRAVEWSQSAKLVKFRVVECLKGSCKDEYVSAFGYTEEAGRQSKKKDFRFRGRSKKGDFSHARPGTYAGMGTAMDYRTGQFYLLFLTNVKGEWCIGRPALSRTQEEVDPNDSPWMVVVKHYIRIAELKDYEKEKAALRELRARAEAGSDPKKYPTGLVSDIDRHFSRPSPMKSYEDLMVFYRSAQTKREREKVLHALAKAGHEEALPMVRNLITDARICNIFLGYLVKLKDREGVETIANHFIKFSWANERWASALVDLADETHTKTMLRVLESCKEQKAGKIILSWFKDHPSPGVVGALRKAVGSEYEKERKWYLTLQLASKGDEEVVRWAIGRIDKVKDPIHFRAIIVITHSPTQAANEIVQKLIANSKEQTLLQVFYSLITDGNQNPRRWDHLEAIISLENKSDSLVRQMKNSLKRRKDEKALSLLKILEQ